MPLTLALVIHLNYVLTFIDRYHTNNTGSEALFADSIVMYIPKTTLLVVSWFML